MFVFDENWIPRGERDRCRSTAATTTTTTIGDDARSIFTEPRSLTERDTGSKHQERASLVSGTKMDRREEEERKGRRRKRGRRERGKRRKKAWRLSKFKLPVSQPRHEKERGPRLRRRNSTEPREPLAKHVSWCGTGIVAVAKFKIRARPRAKASDSA